ncbi:MaoC family dehydratase [Vagococcus sp. DIV0080]|uniref:MaoC family dehydratase n=1 Tax=Candidatus Vagococcus giribetii TaxID=2230876 RepID=A0ABS3HV48_9ENTE|nr:MaoC family dehydratase [Vagococcus sp. DIV0080]MBO0477570.1 MaoC family dehydratase [Vagococcus sp. DIV0080]
MTDVKKMSADEFKVGQTFISEEYQIPLDEIIEFATKYDPQPFHVDEEKAKDSFFKELVASGWHTASVTMKLWIDSIPFEKGAIGLGVNLEWNKPVRPGDTLHVESTIKEINPSKSRPDRVYMKVESKAIDQDGLVCETMTANLMTFR